MRLSRLFAAVIFATLSACSSIDHNTSRHRAAEAVESFFQIYSDKGFISASDITPLKPYLDAELYDRLRSFRIFIEKINKEQYHLILVRRVYNINYFYLSRVVPTSLSIINVKNIDTGFAVKVKATWTRYISEKIGNQRKATLLVYISDDDKYRISDIRFQDFDPSFTLKEFLELQKQRITADIRLERETIQN